MQTRALAARGEAPQAAAGHNRRALVVYPPLKAFFSLCKHAWARGLGISGTIPSHRHAWVGCWVSEGRAVFLGRGAAPLAEVGGGGEGDVLAGDLVPAEGGQQLA